MRVGIVDRLNRLQIGYSTVFILLECYLQRPTLLGPDKQASRNDVRNRGMGEDSLAEVFVLEALACFEVCGQVEEAASVK